MTGTLKAGPYWSAPRAGIVAPATSPDPGQRPMSMLAGRRLGDGRHERSTPIARQSASPADEQKSFRSCSVFNASSPAAIQTAERAWVGRYAAASDADGSRGPPSQRRDDAPSAWRSATAPQLAASPGHSDRLDQPRSEPMSSSRSPSGNRRRRKSAAAMNATHQRRQPMIGYCRLAETEIAARAGLEAAH